MQFMHPGSWDFTSLQCLTLKDIAHSRGNRLQLPNLKTFKVLRIDLLKKEDIVEFIIGERIVVLRLLPLLEDLHFFMPREMKSWLTELHYIDQSDLYSVLNAIGRTRCKHQLRVDVGLTTNELSPLHAPRLIPTTSNWVTRPVPATPVRRASERKDV
ncbi:hypothetical protein NLJ89_g4938 [Agrocybe chaxingu]|uniref:Uncharacterized protein n=1 Tax=Agrocybe chaxingu TaxID=84603 RepID=A0A9W8K153_9AGAR|nr:hypothetical protein NLJ89_g4938 [Agrocybe chaxingu]